MEVAHGAIRSIRLALFFLFCRLVIILRSFAGPPGFQGKPSSFWAPRRLEKIQELGFERQ